MRRSLPALLLALAAFAAVPVSAAHARPAAAKLKVRSGGLASLERSGTVSLRVRLPRAGRVRLAALGRNPSSPRTRVALTRGRTVAFSRAGGRTVRLRLTRRGRRLVARQLRACTPLRVTVAARARGRTSRRSRLLGADPARCAPLAGVNDFSCRPTPAHSRPVVLAHGLGATAEANWGYMAPRLREAGFCVFALTYGRDPRTMGWPYDPGGVIAMERSAPQFAAFVDRVLAGTHANEVDIVGHSEGTVMPRYFLERLGGAAKVGRFVALTPLWRGTEVAGAAILRDALGPLGLSGPAQDTVAGFCESCPQFLRGSAYLNSLNADGEAVPGVEHTNIPTRYDELVVPYTSGLMRDGGTNIVLQDVCPADASEHSAVAFDPAVAQLILNALDPANRKRVPC